MSYKEQWIAHAISIIIHLAIALAIVMVIMMSLGVVDK